MKLRYAAIPSGSSLCTVRDCVVIYRDPDETTVVATNVAPLAACEFLALASVQVLAAMEELAKLRGE